MRRPGNNMTMEKKQASIIIGLVILALSIYFLVGDDKPGQYDDFAKCLTEKNISMAGTESCSYCQKQKKVLGRSFKFIDYHNCDKERQWCAEKGIRSYPTWILPNGGQYTGLQSLKSLQVLSGCRL